MDILTHLSLFSGIGGIDLAAEWAGFTTVGQCELDDYATKVLQKHWPDVPRWGDIRDVTADSFYERTGLRTVDLISGGFPCQPFSVAGQQRGTDDDRYLWPEMLRVIRELNPRWVVAENVPGILPIAGDAVCEGLEREGYSVGIYCFEAAAVGAPHRRERLFFVANSRSRGFGKQGICDKQQRGTKTIGASEIASGIMGYAQRGGRGREPRRRAGEKPTDRYSQLEKEFITNPDGQRFKKFDISQVKHEPGFGCGCCHAGNVANPDSVRQPQPEGCKKKFRGQAGDGGENVCNAAVEGLPDGAEIPLGRPGQKQKFKRPNWWSVEPGVVRSLDGISKVLDGIGGLSNEAKIRANEILRNVWNSDFQEAIQWTLGRFSSISTEEILLAFLCEYEERSNGSWVEMESRAITETILRDLWRIIEITRTPYKRGYIKQYSREYTNALCALSYKAPSLYPEAWAKGSWEIGIERVATGIKNRVDRLKCLGNAVVPQQVYPILKAIYEIERGCSL